MTDFLKDLRHAMRLLARKPGITALAVLSLGLGIGVNTSIFSIVHAVLAPDLPMVRPSVTAIPAEDVTLHPAADGPAYTVAGLLMGWSPWCC